MLRGKNRAQTGLPYTLNFTPTSKLFSLHANAGRQRFVAHLLRGVRKSIGQLELSIRSKIFPLVLIALAHLQPITRCTWSLSVLCHLLLRVTDLHRSSTTHFPTSSTFCYGNFNEDQKLQDSYKMMMNSRIICKFGL